jgi:hypothetical protein
MEIGLLFLICTAFIVWAASNRANIEAKYIQASAEPLGIAWHVQMWLTGKAGTGLLCAIFYGLASDAYGFLAMGFYSMMLYWLCFDLFLNRERGKRLWYISTAKETALSDRLLYWIRRKTGLTEPETHLIVKVPLILLGLTACLYTAL